MKTIVDHKDFPERIQFWWRVGYDRFEIDDWYNGDRIDLQHPQIWWDNDQYQNIITVPDAYMTNL